MIEEKEISFGRKITTVKHKALIKEQTHSDDVLEERMTLAF
jgi:hypothetical protein